MSKQVDERIVSMQFDNRQFEKNVSTTMSTLDKLKAKLNFKGISNGFDTIDKSVKKVDMSTLGNSVETVRAKFSALEVMGVTALANITNSAVNAGKSLVKSLSIDQVTSGWSKYEQKTASVQTIMNATGKSIDEVNGYLSKLMWFSDETSYGFNDMTAALGQMTSSGGDIENLIPLITGVANATAYAGKGASEFSRVMYNLNQSYGSGYLQYMDWKSLELAGIGSKQLKQVFIDTAEEMGKIEKGQVTIANFGTTLKDKWADTEVMERAFGKFGEFSDAVHKLSEDIESGDLSAYPEDIQKLAEDGKLETTSDMIEALSKHYDELGTQAFRSAQEAKTFTEAIDATKDAVSSGWMKTFELIFGTYVDQKKLWTDLANTLWDVFASGGESRNEWLSKVLSYNPLEEFSKKLEKVTKAIGAPVKKLEEYNEIVNRIIRGDFGNGQARFDKLAEAGYDWAHAQNLVNEKLGNSFRYATDYNKAQADQITQTIELTDAKLEEIGLTEEEIKLYRELEAESKKTGKSIGELIEEMEQADTRTLFLGSFKNIGSGLIGIIKALKEGFAEIFPPASAVQIYNFVKGFNELTSKLRLTDAETGELNETGKKLKRTFKGLFAALDIILTIVGGPIKIAFKAITKILGAFDLNILDVTASVGDAIVGFRDWIDSTLDFTEVFEYLAELFKPATDKIRKWIDSFKSLPVVQSSMEKLKGAFSKDFISGALVNGLKGLWNILVAIAKGVKKCYDAFMDLPGVRSGIDKISTVFGDLLTNVTNVLKGIDLDSFVNTISNFFETIEKWIGGIGDYGDNGEDLISGLSNALGGGVKAVVDAITSICKAIYTTFTDFFDINSPSKVFMTLGKFCIAGLIAGLLFSKNDVQDTMGEIGGSLLDGLATAVDKVGGFLKEIDLKTVFAAGGAVAMFTTVNKMIDVMDKFGAATKGFGSMCSSAGKMMDAITGKIAPKKDNFTKNAENILKLAGAVAILAGSVFLLAQLDVASLWSAVGAIAALSLILGGLTFAASKLEVKGADFGKLSALLIGLSASLLIMATAIKKLEFLDWYNMGPILVGLAAMVAGLSLLLLAFGKLTKGTIAKNIGKASMVIAQISFTMLMLSFAIKSISKLDPESLTKGLSTLAIFGVFISALIFATKLAGKEVGAMGGTILKLSLSIIALIGVIKLLGLLDVEEVTCGILCISLFGAVIAGLIAATRLASGSDLKGIGSTLLAISACILIMALTAKMLAKMSPKDMAKGVVCIAAFGGIIVGLIAATKLAGDKSLKGVATTLLAATIAIGMMAAIAVVLSLISLEGLAKGVTAVAILGSIIALMIHATKGAANCKDNIVAMTTAIGIMAASVLVLSLIDPTKLLRGTVAMASLMGMFALMIKAAASAKKAMGTIIVMTIVVGALAGILSAMSYLPNPQALVPVAAAIGILLLTMSAALAVIDDGKRAMTTQKLSRSLTALGVLTAVVAGVGLVLSAMSFLPNPEALVPAAIALSVVLIAMTGVLAALSVIGKFGKQATTGIIGLTAMVIPLAAFALALHMLPSNLGDKKDSILALTTVMGAMTVLLLALTGIGALIALTGAVGPIAGILGLCAMIVPLSLFGLALTKMKPLNPEVVPMILLLTTVMGAMTDMLFKVSILGPLALIGVAAITALSGVMIAIGGLATAVGALVTKFPQLEQFVDTGMGLLIKLANGLGEVIGSFIGGLAEGVMSSLPQIGLMLSQFMINAMGFITGAKMVDQTVWDGAKILVGAILALTAADLINGVSSFLQGGSSLAELGTQLSQFMINALPFITIASTLNESMMSGVKSLAEAILILTAADMIEGLTSWFSGGVSLSDFGSELSGLGTGIADFASELGTFDESKIETINCGAQALKTIAEAASKIPNEGGFLAAIVGDNSIGDFGEQLAGIGSSLSEFITSIGTFGKEQLTTVKNAAKAIVKMAEASDKIPNEGGWVAAIVGDNGAQAFVTQFGSIGSSLASFIASIGTFGKEQLDTVNNAAEAITVIAKAAKEIPNEGGWLSAIAGENSLANFGLQIKAFFESVGSIDTAKMSQITDGMMETLKGIGEAALTGFIDVFKSEDSKSKATSAIKELLEAAASNAQTNEIYSKFEAVGKYVVEGFADGIDKYTYKAEAQAKAMAEAAEKAAKKELDVNSPSKKFMAVGGSVVEGLAKGISSNVGDLKKPAHVMSSAMLDATKSELQINSPSVVFDKEVGRYIVQGIAEGIKKDMTAEEAAEKKAQNIVNAFKKELDKLDVQSSIAEKELELWNLTDGKYASADEKDAKELGYLRGELARKASARALAYDEYLETAKHFAKGSQEEREAWDKYYAAQIEVANIQKQIDDSATNYLERTENALETDSSIADKDYQLIANDNRISEYEKDAKKLDYLADELTRKTTAKSLAYDEYLETLKNFGEGSQEEREAWEKYRDAQLEILNIQNEIDDVVYGQFDRRNDELTKSMDIRSTLQEHWLKTDGRYASDTEIAARQLADTEADLTDLNNQLVNAREQHEWAISHYAADSQEVLDAYNNCIAIENEIADKQEELDRAKLNNIYRDINDLSATQETADLQHQLNQLITEDKFSSKEKNAMEQNYLTSLIKSQEATEAATIKAWAEIKRLFDEGKATQEELDAATKANLQAMIDTQETRNKLSVLNEDIADQELESYEKANDIVDLEYQIWEKTAGRNATSTEKAIAQIGSLSKQLSNSSVLLENARKEWKEAESQFGKDSKEAQDKYAEYLQQELNIANLQDEITTLNEKMAARQKVAASEYKDYVKKYSKYYAANGMSQADLERDARLVSDYNPNRTVNNIMSSTNTALNNVKSSAEYANVITNFQSLGTSYVDAVNEGISNKSNELVAAVTAMVESCVTTIKSEREKWSEAAKYLVGGFIVGIASKLAEVILVCQQMAQSATAAVTEELDINSPSRVFADIGMYAAMGLAKGLVDNAALSDSAASGIGESAVDNLRNAIRQISDVVDSDIDTQPTIRPVLDLSNIKSGTAKLSTMFSRTQAMAINADMASRHDNEIQNGEKSSDKGGNTYQFTQNNYSPKALSATEIYRQTKNQFSAMKGALR